MKSLAVFAILASLHTGLVSADILCGCTLIHKPVCGTDLKTYPNECVLNCESARNVQNGLPPIYVLSKGKCPPPCICNTVDQPVCGTDDKTYGNICRLDCENKRRERLGLPLIKKKHDGPCKIPVCKCDNIIRPVCGSDGKTYRNACFLKCASLEQQAQCKPAIHLKYKGPCIKEACDCPRNYDQVCTKDGRTFNNLCLLECWNRRRNELGLPSLIIDYKGKCVDCRCLDIYNPVCASNEVTFINECVLDCENKKRKRRGLKPLLLVSKGACPCICMLQYDPVCGSDKITYSNPCLLDCENKKRKDLGWPKIWIQYWGKCV